MRIRGEMQRAFRRMFSEVDVLLAPSRFGPLGVLARRALLRVLRPYAVRQREFDAALLDAVTRATDSSRASARTAGSPGADDVTTVTSRPRRSPQKISPPIDASIRRSSLADSGVPTNSAGLRSATRDRSSTMSVAPAKCAANA